MNAAEIILLIIAAAGLLIAAYEHDKPKTGRENFWGSFIGIALNLGLLYWAGLFR